jgi:SAM-dependent methyltransferase
MGDSARSEVGGIPEHSTKDVLYKKDFWGTESLKYSKPHLRMEKVARTVNKLARSTECSLLDVGCGPAALASLLSHNIRYYGVDIAISTPAPNLIEADFLESPIQFGDRKFDIVVAQGVFEYVGSQQEQKFSEIANLMTHDSKFVVSYVNFDHRHRRIYWPYSNVQPFLDFRRSLERHFAIQKLSPTSYNWEHKEPNRAFVRAANMRINLEIPLISRALAVQYIFTCVPLR